jgi:hypothetical protein
MREVFVAQQHNPLLDGVCFICAALVTLTVM